MSFDNEGLERAYARVFHLMQQQQELTERFRKLALKSLILNGILILLSGYLIWGR